MKMKSIKNGGRPLGIVAIVAMIGLAVTACDQSSDPAPSQWTVSLIQNHTSSDNTTVASFVHTNGGQFPANVATPAVRTGYEFTGFWTTRSGGTQYFSAYGVRMAAAGNPRTMDNDLRLYAQWHQGTTPPPDPGPQPPPDPGPGPQPPTQPDVLTAIDLGPIPGIAASGPTVFTLGATHAGEFVELRMTGRSADWHAMDIQFPELITAGYLTASGTYTVRVTGRGGNSAAGVFMIQGIQPGHSWGTTVSLAANAPFTHSRDFTMQAGPQPWAGDSRWAGARLTTDNAGENADIIFTSIEIVRVPGNAIVWSLADEVGDVGPTPGPQPPEVTVTSVTVSPASASVTRGQTQNFSATVAGANNPPQTVTWSIDQTNRHAQTTISTSGVLSVAAAETLTTLTVRATSTVNNTISGTATVTVTAPVQQPTVTSVTVGPTSASVIRGQTQNFSATVAGANNPPQTVTWSIDQTNRHAQTTISTSGVLSVAAAETLTTLTVRATSTANTAISGTATVTITAPPPIAWNATLGLPTGAPAATAYINLMFGGYPAGLVAADIAIAHGTGSAIRGNLVATGFGNIRRLYLSNVRGGTVYISITRTGIASEPRQVTLVGPAATSFSLDTSPMTVAEIHSAHTDHQAEIFLQNSARYLADNGIGSKEDLVQMYLAYLTAKSYRLLPDIASARNVTSKSNIIQWTNFFPL